MISAAKQAIPMESRQRLRALLNLPRNLWGLITNYAYDFRLFLSHSSTLQLKNSRKQQQAWIDADAHKLEKGMALEAPRPGFGKGVAERLIRELTLYREKYSDDSSVQNAIRVLEVYRDFNQRHHIHYDPLFADIDHLATFVGRHARGGCTTIDRNAWYNDARKDLLPFFRSRRSVRDFSDEPVNFSDIEKAVEMAMYTPTVCNRQAIKAHAYTNPEEIQSVIGCQMGNSGFGHKVKTLLMVTVDRQCFFTEAERNQCWIDGGLFAMSLVYGLHSLGLGSCCLNWSVTRERDKMLKKVTGLKDSDAVIMMIAVGHLKDQFKVATSARKNLNHFLVKGIQA